MNSKKSLTVITVLFISLLLTLGGSVLGAEKAWEKINWDEPKPHAERLTADHYVLPEGWEEATQGVEKITFYNSGSLEYDIATKTNMERFTELTGIEVEAIPLAADLVLAKSTSTLVSKDTSIDGVLMNTTAVHLSPLASTGWLQPVDPLYPPEVLDLYIDTYGEALKWDGHFYGLPVTYISHGPLYRPSYLEKAGQETPDTFKEFDQALGEVNQWMKKNEGESYYGTVFACGTKMQLQTVFRNLVYIQGGRIYKNDEYQFDSKEVKKAFNWMINAFKEDYITEAALNYAWGDVGQAFESGKAASMLGMQPSYLSYYQQTDIGKDVGLLALKWDKETPEKFRGGNVVGMNTIGVNNYIDNNSKAALMLFGDYLRSVQAQRNELVVEGNGSGMKYLWNNIEEQLKLVNWEFVNKQAKDLGLKPYEPVKDVEEFSKARGAQKILNFNGFMTPYPPSISQVLEKFKTEFQKAVQGKVSSEKALQNIDSFANEF